MSLSIDQLRAFVETVEQGSFRKAAAQIGKHSSTVSEQVANLEIDLGLTLFERSRRGITLTEHGKQMHEYALPILHEAELFLEKADSLLAQQPERFTLALDPSLGCPEVTNCCQQVVKQFPSIELNILTGDAMQVLSWIRSGRADVGMMPTMFNTAMDMTISRGFAFELVHAIGPQVELDQGSLSYQKVRSTPQVMHSYMLEAGVGHQISHHGYKANNTEAVLEMVTAGMGWAMVPGYLAEPYIREGLIQQFHIDNAKSELWFSDIIHLTSNPVNPAMKLFIDLAKQIPDKL